MTMPIMLLSVVALGCFVTGWFAGTWYGEKATLRDLDDLAETQEWTDELHAIPSVEAHEPPAPAPAPVRAPVLRSGPLYPVDTLPAADSYWRWLEDEGKWEQRNALEDSFVRSLV